MIASKEFYDYKILVKILPPPPTEEWDEQDFHKN
jgi:hypothetical protein